jgi:hypothetical protein
MRERIEDRDKELESLTKPIGGAWVTKEIQSMSEKMAQDEALHRLLAMYRRTDVVANFDNAAYQILSIASVVALTFTLVMVQLFSSWSYFAYILLYLVGLMYFWWARRWLKSQERARAVSRCLAEVLRVQVAWRIAGNTEVVSDRLEARRMAALGEFRFLLEPIALLAVWARPEGTHAFESDAIEAVRRGWAWDQFSYTRGASVRRKQRKSKRRERRKHWLRVSVVFIALLAFVATMVWGRDSALEAWFDWVNFSIGLSLVFILITDLRGSIALDREDAEAAEKMHAVYRAAYESLGEAPSKPTMEFARQVLLELGDNVLDEQVEWYMKHRDGAQVDVVG